MKRVALSIPKLFLSLFNTRAAGIYILVFAASIAAATFIENDFGSSAAQKVVYQAWWFELLLLLFGISILVNIIRFRMIPQRKWALLLFHAAILVILLGAALTRYLGYEGMMHIRENSTSNYFLSSDMYLSFRATQGERKYEVDEPVRFASLGNNHWKASYLLDQDLLEIEVESFIPNPRPVLYQNLEGRPMLKIVLAGEMGREEYFLEAGKTQQLGRQVFTFNAQARPDAINVVYRNDSLLLKANKALTQTVMATQQRDTLFPTEAYRPLALRALYSDGLVNFVFAAFHESGQVRVESEDPKVKNESVTALQLAVSVNGETKQTYVYGQKGFPGRGQALHFGDLHVELAYGAKAVQLPFSIHLYDFIIEKYPGTNSAASYASEVMLIDARNNLREDHRIYMNNVLDYEGYRFFQSSFDRDERGTYLSVNHDYWGTRVSYLGYALLTLGMLLTLLSKKSRFQQVQRRLQGLRAQHAAFILLFLVGFSAQAKEINLGPQQAVEPAHAAKFSRIIVQDYKGRMKPMHTLSREVLRKVARKESWEGLNADQAILSMFAESKVWYQVPLIKLGKHKELLRKLEVERNYASYADFFYPDGSYKLREEMQRVHSLAPIDQGVYEKELLKVDERVNILSMVFSGDLLRVVPLQGDPNHTWVSNHTHGHESQDNHGFHVADKFFAAYRATLREAMQNGDYAHADHLLDELKDYQQKYGAEVMPSAAQVRGEILLNRANIFSRLSLLYALLGLAFLTLQFIAVFRPDVSLQTVYKGLLLLAGIGFLFHTLGLGLRWYVSGRAPWSNGYESMIYIAWTTTLAGGLFTRKSFGGMAATMVLAATILFVATLSFLDPEITPLVPVLRSYWLTIHVSMEAGSYGFLMLGGIIGLINLIMMALLRESNKERVKRIMQEMTGISELTLSSGLIMISIGTFLGGVWANESWGRYWGWDAKETWALVTILIYAFILHMRLIPRMYSLFSFNLASIFGLASVIMTYYGVNYYLSGLHSYATGDPVPIPTWVYVLVGFVALISSAAFLKKRKFLS